MTMTMLSQLLVATVQHTTPWLEPSCWKTTDYLDEPDYAGHRTHWCRRMGCCWGLANLEGVTTHSRLCAAVSECMISTQFVSYSKDKIIYIITKQTKYFPSTTSSKTAEPQETATTTTMTNSNDWQSYWTSPPLMLSQICILLSQSGSNNSLLVAFSATTHTHSHSAVSQLHCRLHRYRY